MRNKESTLPGLIRNCSHCGYLESSDVTVKMIAGDPDFKVAIVSHSAVVHEIILVGFKSGDFPQNHHFTKIKNPTKVYISHNNNNMLYYEIICLFRQLECRNVCMHTPGNHVQLEWQLSASIHNNIMWHGIHVTNHVTHIITHTVHIPMAGHHHHHSNHVPYSEEDRLASSVEFGQSPPSVIS